MPQNLISISFTQEDRVAIHAAIEQLKRALISKTIALDTTQRRELCKMGPSSENFCHEALAVLDKNRQIVPPSLGLDEALRDQLALSVIRPALQELEQLLERLRDTDMALGSDMMDTSLEGYRLLKHLGRNQGLDGLVNQLGARFAKRAKRELPVPVEA